MKELFNLGNKLNQGTNTQWKYPSWYLKSLNFCTGQIMELFGAYYGTFRRKTQLSQSWCQNCDKPRGEESTVKSRWNPTKWCSEWWPIVIVVDTSLLPLWCIINYIVRLLKIVMLVILNIISTCTYVIRNKYINAQVTEL